MFIQTKLVGRAFCLALCASFAGCTASGTALGTSPLESQSGSLASLAQTARAAPGNVRFSIGIPAKKNVDRVTAYHGVAMTRSLRIATETGTSITVDLDGPASACAANLRVPQASLCTSSLQAPAGSHIFTVIAYDAPGARGNVLSKNSTRPIDVKPAGATNVPLVVGGPVSYAIVMLSKIDPTVYVAAAIDIVVALLDADQEYIVGAAPFDNPLTLTTSDSTNGPLTKKLLLSPADATTSKTDYDGANVASITYSVTATGLPPANVTSAVLRPSPALVDSGLVYVANENSNSITAYTTGASGNARPVSVIAGKDTLITYPIGLAHDPQGHLYVACLTNSGGRVLVFAPHANGDATPIRWWQTNLFHSPKTPGPAFPSAIAVDGNGYAYVAMTPSDYGPTTGGIEVFDSSARGLASPIRVFAESGENYFQLAVNAAGEVYDLIGPDRYIPGYFYKYSNYADGNVLLSSPQHSVQDDFQKAGGVAVAPTSGNVYAINKVYPPTIRIYDPAIKDAIGQIAGTNTGLGYGAMGIAFDAAGRIYVGNSNGALADSVEVFSGSASDNAFPTRVIGGSNTGLHKPVAITIIR